MATVTDTRAYSLNANLNVHPLHLAAKFSNRSSNGNFAASFEALVATTDIYTGANLLNANF